MIEMEDVNSKEPLRTSQTTFDIRKTGVTRFVVAGILSVSLFLTCEIWLSLSAVETTTKLYFKESGRNCEWFGAVFFVTFALQAIPALFIPQLIGIKRCIVCGTTFIFIGCLMRTVAFLLGFWDGTTVKHAESSFWIVIFGNVIVSLSQGFLNNIPSWVSSVFFEEKQQLTATTWIVNGCILGSAIVFVFVPLVVGTSESILEIQKKYLIVTGVESVASLMVLLASVFLIPSSKLIQQENIDENKKNLNVKQKWESLLCSIKEALHCMWRLLKSPTFIILFVIYGLYYAISGLFYLRLNNIIDETLTSNANILIWYGGSLAVFAGFTFSTLLGHLLSKYGSFRISIFASSLLMFMNAVPLFVMLMLMYYKIHNKASISILIIFYGMVAAPYLSLGYDIMSKAAAPISENIPVTVALIFSNIFSVSLLYGFQYIPSAHANQTFLILATCLYICMGVAHLFIKMRPLEFTS